MHERLRWQSVWLEAVPHGYIRSFRVDTSLDGVLEVRVETSEPTQVEVRVGEEQARLAAPRQRDAPRLGDVAGFVWTQLTDVEGELNGLLTCDRVPKVDAQRIREVNERFRSRRP